MATLVFHSLWVSIGAALAAGGLGLLAALAALFSPPRLRTAYLVLAVVVLGLPPFLLTNTWLDLAGWNGPWKSWLPSDLSSPWGVVFVLSLWLWPVSFLLVWAAWGRVQAEQLDCDASLRGWALCRHLLWPMARGPWMLGFLLVFVLAANNVAVPAILQVRVLPASLWIQFNTTFDHAAALRVGWPLLLIPCLLALVLWRRPVAWPRESGRVHHKIFSQRFGSFCIASVGAATGLLFFLSLAVPMAQLMGSAKTWAEWPVVWQSAFSTISNSFVLAAMAATGAVLLALATWRCAWGWVLAVPFLIPGVWLGIGLIQLFNRPYLHEVYRSPLIVVVAWIIRYSVIAWLGLRWARQSLDPELIDAARLHTQSRWQGWRHGCWPQIASAAACAWYVTFLFCLWDVETLILIVPPGGETLALRIFNLLHYGHNAQVNAMCLILILLALIPGLVWQAGRWTLAGWKRP